MKDIVDLELFYTTKKYTFEITLDCETIVLPGGEVTTDGETYNGTLVIKDSKFYSEEQISIYFEDLILDGKLAEKLEKLVIEQYYRLDTNKN